MSCPVISLQPTRLVLLRLLPFDVLPCD